MIRYFSVLLPLCLIAASALAAPVIYAPIGGAPIHPPQGHVACPLPTDNQGWSVSPDGQSIKPPAIDTAIGQPVRLTYTDALPHCADSKETLTLTAVGPRPVVDWSTATWDVDGGEIVVHGQRLKGSQLHWSFAEKSGQDRCTTPTLDGLKEQCFFAIDRTLPAVPEQLQVKLFPAGLDVAPDATLYDAQGQPATWPSPGFISDAVLSKLLPSDATADVGDGVAHLRILHPEAVDSVDCEDASCDIDGSVVVVRDEHGSDNILRLRLSLRPHLSLRNGSPPRAPQLSVPIQRCPLSLASQTVFRGLSDQRVAVRLGGRCADDPTLQVWGPSGPAPIVGETRSGGARYVLVQVGRIDGDELVVTVRRDDTIVGRASEPTQSPPQVDVRIELPGIGPISFIPTNRPARALLPPPPPGLTWGLKSLPGFYDVGTNATGVTVQGVAGAAGAVSLRLTLRDRNLPAPLQNVDLVELTDPAFRAIRVAHVPVALAEEHTSSPLIELECGDGHGNVSAMPPGTTSYISYTAHDTCHVLLHAERLSPENGSQTIRFVVDVNGSDGSNKSEAHIDRRLVLRPGGQPETLYLRGIDTPFDRMRVRLSVEPDASAEEGIAAPTAVSEVQWTLIFGTSRGRLYATMTFPTGLFRVSDEAHSGILTLNAGALLRAVLLSKDGQENPFGLEAGAIWLAIAGDGTGAASGQGQVALVLGLGVGVPIANASRLTQTSINLHAWVEYELSRAALRQAGSPWGIIFGPSLTIGDAGRNF